MTVAIKPTVSSSRKLRSAKPDLPTGQNKVTPISGAVAAQSEKAMLVLPQTETPPLWLRKLMGLQQSSSLVTLVLVAACLSVYGWTVYSQQAWKQESRKLESLRKQERQLLLASEVLKHDIAKLAERPGSGLVLPDPSHVIFIEPARVRPRAATGAGVVAKPATAKEDGAGVPVGY